MSRAWRSGAAALLLALLAAGVAARAAEAESLDPGARAIEIPRWFSESFLEFPEEVRDAAAQGKRVMVYIGQDGCPYCKALMEVDFRTPDIVEKTRRRFVAIALNLWGDREVTWVDGRHTSEKALARALGIQFTPTLLFLDEKGKVALRLNGYLPPDRFRVALAYAAGEGRAGESYAEYAARHEGDRRGALVAEPFLEPGPLDLPAIGARTGKPLAVLIERSSCKECEELHRDAFSRPEVRALLARFAVVQVDLFGGRPVVTPSGERRSERAWARSLGVAYTPTLLFLDGEGHEAFRVEGYVRPFHLAGALDYVASGAYREEPDFQRYLQKRADAMRSRGKSVDLWK